MDSIWFVFLVQGLLFGFFTSFIAKEKGRDPAGWFFMGLFFSLLAILALVAIPRQQVGGLPSERINLPKSALCPFCREEINAEAVICKHCRSDLSANRPVLPEKVTIAEKVAVPLVEIKCPNCSEVEKIPSDQQTNPDIFKKFSTDFVRLFNPRLTCKHCGTNIPYDPFHNGIFTGGYRRQLTNRSNRGIG